SRPGEPGALLGFACCAAHQSTGPAPRNEMRGHFRASSHASRPGEAVALRERGSHITGPRNGAQLLKYQVSVWAMCGLSLTALFHSRSGTLPMLFLITRTPCDAGEFETTGISHISSSAIFQTSLASRVRSASGTLNERR